MMTVVKWGAGFIAVLGAMVLADYAAGPITRVGPVPMAVSTATLFIMTGILLWLLADEVEKR